MTSRPQPQDSKYTNDLVSSLNAALERNDEKKLQAILRHDPMAVCLANSPLGDPLVFEFVSYVRPALFLIPWLLRRQQQKFDVDVPEIYQDYDVFGNIVLVTDTTLYRAMCNAKPEIVLFLLLEGADEDHLCNHAKIGEITPATLPAHAVSNRKFISGFCLWVAPLLQEWLGVAVVLRDQLKNYRTALANATNFADKINAYRHMAEFYEELIKPNKGLYHPKIEAVWDKLQEEKHGTREVYRRTRDNFLIQYYQAYAMEMYVKAVQVLEQELNGMLPADADMMSLWKEYVCLLERISVLKPAIEQVPWKLMKEQILEKDLKDLDEKISRADYELARFESDKALFLRLDDVTASTAHGARSRSASDLSTFRSAASSEMRHRRKPSSGLFGKNDGYKSIPEEDPEREEMLSSDLNP